MAIQLYRAGTTHIVRGIECEVCNFDSSQMQHQLEQGWVKAPEFIDEITEEVAEETTEEATEIHPVRIQARDAGIDGWENKRIKTLESELDG